MEDTKPIEGVRHKEELDSGWQQLSFQGKALEELEKTYGIWRSVKLHRIALVYSILDLISDENISLQ